MVAGITKYAVCVTDPQMIRYHLDRAIYLATSGRPGPCWLDIPVDVQSAFIDPDSLRAYDPQEDEIVFDRNAISGSMPRCDRTHPCGQAAPSSSPAAACASATPSIFSITSSTVLAFPLLPHGRTTSSPPMIPCSVAGRAPSVTAPAISRCKMPICYWCLALAFPSAKSATTGNRSPTTHLLFRSISMQRNWPSQLIQPNLPIHCDCQIVSGITRRTNRRATQYDATLHAAWLSWCKKERVRRYPTVLPKHREFHGRNQPLPLYGSQLFDHLGVK